MTESNKKKSLTHFFGTVAQSASQKLGHAGSFVTALLLIVVWAALGPAFDYSNTWQLVINTGTTIVTFLMVFLIQNTQNRDMAALHLKLDELIRVNVDARDKLLNLEDLTEGELTQLKENFLTIGKQSDQTDNLEGLKDSLRKIRRDQGAAQEEIPSATSAVERK